MSELGRGTAITRGHRYPVGEILVEGGWAWKVLRVTESTKTSYSYVIEAQCSSKALADIVADALRTMRKGRKKGVKKPA